MLEHIPSRLSRRVSLLSGHWQMVKPVLHYGSRMRPTPSILLEILKWNLAIFSTKMTPFNIVDGISTIFPDRFGERSIDATPNDRVVDWAGGRNSFPAGQAECRRSHGKLRPMFCRSLGIPSC